MNIKTVVKKPDSGTKWSNYLLLVLLLIVGVCFLPLLIVFGGIVAVYQWIFRKKKAIVKPVWNSLPTGTDLMLRYKYVNADELPDFVRNIDAILLQLESNPKLEFFEGYFTDVKIARHDGIFIQKVVLHDGPDKMYSLPLYFFDYATETATFLHDLTGYELEVRGNVEDFTIFAYRQDEIMEINIAA